MSICTDESKYIVVFNAQWLILNKEFMIKILLTKIDLIQMTNFNKDWKIIKFPIGNKKGGELSS